MRAKRFSSPSMYFALGKVSQSGMVSGLYGPFRWLALLFDLSEDTFCLVVQTVRAGGL